MEECSLPKARPISCNDSPACQRRHTSPFCTAESPNRFRWIINTTFGEKIYIKMVLQRPVELAAVTGEVGTRTNMSGYPCIRSSALSMRF